MSEPPDPLEAELSALRPHGVSPELRRRIALRLVDAPLTNSGRLWLKAGSGWAGGFTGNVDDLTVGIDTTSVTYNFEP